MVMGRGGGSVDGSIVAVMSPHQICLYPCMLKKVMCRRYLQLCLFKLCSVGQKGCL